MSSKQASAKKTATTTTAAPSQAHLASKVIVIGDIHGYIDKLKALWQHLQSNLGEDMDNYLVVFLGDFVDRGPDTKAVIEWLINLKVTRPNTVCIAGNHEFAMCGYLGLLVDPITGSADFESTWSRSDIYVRLGEREQWYSGPGSQQMHLQGRRWGGGRHDSLYNCSPTIKSYGLSKINDRDAFLHAIPESHKQFLRDLPWIHEIPGYIFVHAGLETPGFGYSDMTIPQQLDFLRRKLIVPRPEMLCGREAVFSTPQELIDQGICVISGHHNTVHYGRNRIIMDRSGGYRTGVLQAMVLPLMLTVDHEGVVEPVDRGQVFA